MYFLLSKIFSLIAFYKLAVYSRELLWTSYLPFRWVGNFLPVKTYRKGDRDECVALARRKCFHEGKPFFEETDTARRIVFDCAEKKKKSDSRIKPLERIERRL